MRIAQYFMRYYRTKHLQWLLVFRDLIQQQGQTFGSRATSQLRSQIYKSWYFSNHLKKFKSRRVLNPLFGGWLNNKVSNPLFTFLMIWWWFRAFWLFIFANDLGTAILLNQSIIDKIFLMTDNLNQNNCLTVLFEHDWNGSAWAF